MSSRLIENAIPILPVCNLKASVRFYVDILGFTVDWGDVEDGRICSVSRDGCCIMLSQSEKIGSPAWVWIGLEDDSLFAVYRSAGVKVVQEARNYSWAYEMKFADLDGNVLWLGAEPKADRPFEDRREGEPGATGNPDGAR